MSDSVDTTKNSDGKYILVQEGRGRIGGPFGTREAAEAEANKQKLIQESQGIKVDIRIVQNLFD